MVHRLSLPAWNFFAVVLVWMLVCTWKISSSTERRPSPTQSSSSRSERMEQCQAASRQRLLAEFSNATGLFSTTGWWNSANVFTALVHDASLSLTHSEGTREEEGRAAATAYARAVLTMVNTTYAIYGTTTHFLDDYNDDEGWWGLMFAAAHDLALALGYPKEAADFLSTSRFLWEDMKNSWNASAAACGGGIWWSKTIHYKNAIANELFIALAAELAWRDAADPSDQASLIAFAEQALAWFNQSGMRNAQGTFNDGLTPQCTNNNQTVWSYNQGVILGGLAALYRTLASLGRANESMYLLDEAVSIYYAAVAALADEERNHNHSGRGTTTTPLGILRDPCEPNCGADGCQFKGVFLRNVMQLAEVLSEFPVTMSSISSPDGQVTTAATARERRDRHHFVLPPQREEKFLRDLGAMRNFTRRNAESICANDAPSPPTNASSVGWLGIQWAGPFLAESASACTTSSAYDGLVGEKWFELEGLGWWHEGGR